MHAAKGKTVINALKRVILNIRLVDATANNAAPPPSGKERCSVPSRQLRASKARLQLRTAVTWLTVLRSCCEQTTT